MEQWSVTDVAEWVASAEVGHKSVAGTFRSEEVDGGVLAEIPEMPVIEREQFLQRLGFIGVDPMMKFVMRIKKLKKPKEVTAGLRCSRIALALGICLSLSALLAAAKSVTWPNSACQCQCQWVEGLNLTKEQSNSWSCKVKDVQIMDLELAKDGSFGGYKVLSGFLHPGWGLPAALSSLTIPEVEKKLKEVTAELPCNRTAIALAICLSLSALLHAAKCVTWCHRQRVEGPDLAKEKSNTLSCKVEDVQGSVGEIYHHDAIKDNYRDGKIDQDGKPVGELELAKDGSAEVSLESIAANLRSEEFDSRLSAEIPEIPVSKQELFSVGEIYNDNAINGNYKDAKLGQDGSPIGDLELAKDGSAEVDHESVAENLQSEEVDSRLSAEIPEIPVSELELVSVGEIYNDDAITGKYKDAKLGQDGSPDFELAKDGSVQGYKVLIGLFTVGWDLPATIGSLTIPELERKGLQVLVRDTMDAFTSALRAKKVHAAWIISGSANSVRCGGNVTEFVAEVRRFHEAGRGLQVWGSFVPYFANLVLRDLFNFELIGGTFSKGGELVPGNPNEPGHFDRDFKVFAGIEHLYEGDDKNYLSKVPPGWKVFATSSDEKPLLVAKEASLEVPGKPGTGRVIVDTGYKKLLKECWTTGDTARYMSNCAAWLLLRERFEKPESEFQ